MTRFFYRVLPPTATFFGGFFSDPASRRSQRSLRLRIRFAGRRFFVGPPDCTSPSSLRNLFWSMAELFLAPLPGSILGGGGDRKVAGIRRVTTGNRLRHDAAGDASICQSKSRSDAAIR